MRRATAVASATLMRRSVRSVFKRVMSRSVSRAPAGIIVMSSIAYLLVAAARNRANNSAPSIGAIDLKKPKKNGKRREWTKADLKELKAHSKARTPVAKISKATKQTVGA